MPLGTADLPLAVLCSVQFIVVLDDNVVSVALPSLRDGLGGARAFPEEDDACEHTDRPGADAGAFSVAAAITRV